MATFRLERVIPVVERLIAELLTQHAVAARDALVAAMVNDMTGRALVDRAKSKNKAWSERQVAGNMVDWFSANYALRGRLTESARARFDRTKVGGKWAYFARGEPAPVLKVLGKSRLSKASGQRAVDGETAQEQSTSAVAAALYNLSEPLGRSYQQVLSDLADENRMSWAGTAHEIRQILSTLLHALAPDVEVKKRSGYRQDPNAAGPTQKQRVHYVLSKRDAGSKETDVVEMASSLDQVIAELVRASYSRASDAAHRFKGRKEVLRILRYFDAFAYDLLDL